MNKQKQFLGIMIVAFCVSPLCMAEETYFFWSGSAPDSVSWAPFNWEDQGRASGFATKVDLGEFYNHTPDADNDAELNRSLTFSFADGAINQGAHHPTVLPGGVGTVSLWVYYDKDFGFVAAGNANSIILSTQPGPDLVKDAYIGLLMIEGEDRFKVITSDNPTGIDGPAMIPNDWNHITFEDDRNSSTVSINGEEAGLSLSSGGNLWYFNYISGIIQSDGTIQNGDAPETWYLDDILCISSVASGIESINVPMTANTVSVDGVIHPDEITGANSVSWDGSSTERPGVHAQFYGQWELPSPTDLTATVYLQNDGTKLYISIDVLDDVIELRDGGSWWEEDSTEIYLDHDNSRSTTGADQISLRADNGASNTSDFSNWLNIDSKVKSDNSGWQVEAAIDMSARGLAQGESYGFDISINDSDGENEPGYQGAQEWLYASYETAYYNETYWGNITILDTELPIDDWQVY